MYTPKVLQLRETKCLNRAKKEGLVYTQSACSFKGKKGKLHIHQTAFQVVAGDHIARYWCIDFGVLQNTHHLQKLHVSLRRIHPFPEI